ncbi:hypothetical protein BDK89_3301 [Ilumatobacter fluminis]|uniref:Uncharacterized protein n=1 Tax=Ilumatobacter fluminis TaxID=467091 RepID=A0A4R7I375_9ACTN|nr:hypothetical protein [Ilumatobacter fluminis]TDT17690.1 hypothetical protein BDK89_3301 [Ilumatobacter fluminis]
METTTTTTTTATATTSATRNHRSGWAAFGAAVAVTLGAGGMSMVSADTSPEGAATFVGTDPCRILDTRDAPNRVNSFDTLGPSGTITVTASGDVGNCKAADGTAIPAAATGLQLNVTALGASAITDLRVFPGAGAPPTASNLNPYPGEPPVPNAVTVKLDDSDRFSIWNNQGNVDVLVDVVGYYTDEFTITGDEVQNNTLTKVDILDEAGAAYAGETLNPNIALDSDSTTVGSVRLNIPADGLAIVHADIVWSEVNNGFNDVSNCQIVKAGSTYVNDDPYIRMNDNGGDTGYFDQSSGHRTFEVSTADNTGDVSTGFGVTFNLVCLELNGDMTVVSTYMTAEYVPTNRAPLGDGGG